MGNALRKDEQFADLTESALASGSAENHSVIGASDQAIESDISLPPGSAGPSGDSESDLAGVAGRISPYAISLEFFSGPMDLLLHLVSRQDVPIERVKMSIVAEQYLELVTEQSEILDLELAGEYLVIAATLLDIKSRSLLPIETTQEDLEPSGWDENNPFFANLRDRIREYQVTQVRATALRRLPQLGVHTFTRNDRKALLPTPEMLQEPEDVYSLGKMFAALLNRIGGVGEKLRISLHPVTVVSVMVKIVDNLKDLFSNPDIGRRLEGNLSTSNSGRKLKFVELLAFIGGGRAGLAEFSVNSGDVADAKASQEPPTRSFVIAGFVAILELAKRGVVYAEQPEGEELIVSQALDTTPEAIDSSSLSSEFDELERVDLEALSEASQTEDSAISAEALNSSISDMDTEQVGAANLESEGFNSENLLGVSLDELKLDLEANREVGQDNIVHLRDLQVSAKKESRGNLQ